MPDIKGYTYHMTPFIGYIQNGEIHEYRKQVGDCQVLWGRSCDQMALTTGHAVHCSPSSAVMEQDVLFPEQGYPTGHTTRLGGSYCHFA